MSAVILATNNSGKVREFQDYFADLNIEIIPQSKYSVTEIAETGLSFVENAILKARHAAQHTGLPAIADDSGIEVDALMGAPGIYSARYAGPMASVQNNNEKLLRELAKVPKDQRTARFQCLLVYLKSATDPTPLICQGTWEGYILEQAQGRHGFGYDPLFYVPQYDCSAAELPPELKNQISHRAQALHQLVQLLRLR